MTQELLLVKLCITCYNASMQIKPYGHSEFINFKEGPHLYLHHGEIISSVTGITGVVDKPGLIIWAANQAGEEIKDTLVAGVGLDEIEIEKLVKAASTRHTKHRDSAGGIGRLVHNAIQAFIENEFIDKGQMELVILRDCAHAYEPVNVVAKASYQAWVAAMADSFIGMEFIEAERVVWNRNADYIGTLDAMGYWPAEKRFVLFDWKTSKGSYAEHGLQVAGYFGAVHSAQPKIHAGNTERCIIHIPCSRQGHFKIYDEYTIQKELTGQSLAQDYNAFLGAAITYKWKQATPMEKRMKYIRRK